jgi:hypothetical protein
VAACSGPSTPFGAAVIAFLLSISVAPAYAVSERTGPAPVKESYKLPISPPRDQGDSDLCWAFATLSMLESNFLQKHPGAKVEFSRGALQRASIADRFERLISGNSAHLEDGGVAVDAIALIRQDGLVAAGDFHDYVDSDPIFAALPPRLARVSGLAEKRRRLSAALARALGATPVKTHLDGKPATPLAAAKAVLGDETWTEYDVQVGGAPHVGPNDDPDARPGTQAHFVARAAAVDLIHRSLARGEAVVWGRTDNHALVIFGGDYDAEGRPVDYWIKDSFAPYVYLAPADDIHKVLTDVTVAAAPDDALTAEKN